MRPNVMTYSHFNNEVQVMQHLKGKHRLYCLCYLCENFKPGQKDNCEIAKATYDNCVKHNIVTPMWECPNCVPKESSVGSHCPSCKGTKFSMIEKNMDTLDPLFECSVCGSTFSLGNEKARREKLGLK